MKLNFKQPQGNVPMQPCNNCGENKPSAFMAEHPKDDEILIVACSERCVHAMNEHPDLEAYLDGLYDDVQELKRQGGAAC